MARAERPLEEVRVAAGMIWRAYREQVPLPPPVAHVTRCAATRLLAWAMERVNAAGGLTGVSILQTQLAASMLERPDAAAHELLGLA